MIQRSQPNIYPMLSQSMDVLSQGKRRLTATELKQIQKLRHESSLDLDPYLNQRYAIKELSLQKNEETYTEKNTKSNGDIAKIGDEYLLQSPFPDLKSSEFGEAQTTCSISDSLMDLFSTLTDEISNRKKVITQNKKEEKAKDTYKWSPSDLSIKTDVTFFSTKPLDKVFDMNMLLKKPSFPGENSPGSNKESTGLPAQYKYVKQSQQTGVSDSDYINAMRSVYTAFKREYNKKFYILLRGITCLFLHKKVPITHIEEKRKVEDPSMMPFSSMVVIACERKSFQQTLVKNEINFEHYTQQDNEESDIIEKINMLGSQTAFTNSFDLVNNLEIYFVRNKHVQAFVNLMLNEMNSEPKLEIVSEYFFANSAIFYPKVFLATLLTLQGCV